MKGKYQRLTMNVGLFLFTVFSIFLKNQSLPPSKMKRKIVFEPGIWEVAGGIDGEGLKKELTGGGGGV